MLKCASEKVIEGSLPRRCVCVRGENISMVKEFFK